MKARQRKTLAQDAMARLRREGVPGPCACGKNRDRNGYTAKYVFDRARARFSPALCPECGAELPLIPLTEATP